jgi:uncharacterized protein YwqG
VLSKVTPTSVSTSERGRGGQDCVVGPEVIEGARALLLLAQFDSDDAAGFTWGGDAGVLYFMIRTRDLARRDFGETTSTWQCG